MHRATAPLLTLGLLLACGPASHEATPDAGPGELPGDRPDGEATGDEGDEPGDGCSLAPAQDAVQSYFTRSLPTADTTIEDQLVATLEAAGPGSVVRAAFAYLDRAKVAFALVHAQERGADVRVVLDERNQIEEAGTWRWRDAVEHLRQELGDRLVICGGQDMPADGGGCIGAAKQHNSFLLVTDTCDGSTAIVAQTSAYPTKSHLSTYNNLVVVRDDAALFAAYLSYWDDLTAQERAPDYFRVTDGDAATRLYLYPRASDREGDGDPGTDTIYRLLHDVVECTGGTEVKIATAYWTSQRRYLVDELDRLVQEGCLVSAVIDPDKVDDTVEAELAAALGNDRLRLLAGVHHKMVLVDGLQDGASRKVVFAGTQDLTLAALRDNDEVLLRIEDPGAHADFVGAFGTMFAEGTPPAAELPAP
jgi:hypothetical protein